MGSTQGETTIPVPMVLLDCPDDCMCEEWGAVEATVTEDQAREWLSPYVGEYPPQRPTGPARRQFYRPVDEQGERWEPCERGDSERAVEFWRVECLTWEGEVGGIAAGRARHSVQRDVEDFHRALDIPVGESPAIRRPQLRAALIAEEAQEALQAITGRSWVVAQNPEVEPVEGDLVEAIDGLCDLLCVVYGTAAEFGVDLAPFWDEVHRTNMAKRGGPVRADGKRLKPEGWVPPNIAGILAELQGGAA